MIMTINSRVSIILLLICLNVGEDGVGVVNGHPLFFDSLFPSFQSTTPETVVSDYRQKKRADSSVEHEINSNMKGKMNEFSENNVEFYAEVIGKLIGTIRDGVTTLIDDVKQRKQQKRNKSLINEIMNGNSFPSNITMHNAVQQSEIEDETNKLINDSTSNKTHRSSNENDEGVNTEDVMTKNHEMKSTILQLQHVNDALNNSMEAEENQIVRNQSEEKSSRFAWNDVVQIIARRTKRNQSEFAKQSEDIVESLTSPTDSHLSDDHDDDGITNEHHYTPSGQKISISSKDNESWFNKHKQFLTTLSRNHRVRKAKLLNLVMSVLIPDSHNDSIILNNLRTSLNAIDSKETDEDYNLVPSEETSSLTFSLMRGNSTIIQLTPKQIFRMFHRGSDEHSELQKRAKAILQSIFYKYVRLYLIARKGYKDARNFNRKAKELFPNEHQTSTFSSDPISEALQSYNEFKELYHDDDGEDDLIVASNHARTSFQAIEAFAILIIEILGTILALTIGTLSQIEAG